jgi:hypothetical protein
MNDNNPQRKEWVHLGLQLTEDQIREAMSKTTSNKKASQYLDVSYPTYKKYAKMYRDWDTGKTLFELHMNEAMKGVVGRTWIGGKPRMNWDNILRENQKATPERLLKLKQSLIDYNKLECRCYRCNYNQQRIEDHKVPLLLNFKNGDKTNWKMQNIEFVCYNCAFVYALDFFDESVTRTVESYMINAKQGKKEKSEFYQLDDFYLDYIKKLGIELDHLNKDSVEKADTIQVSERQDDVNDLIDYL